MHFIEYHEKHDSAMGYVETTRYYNAVMFKDLWFLTPM